MKLSDFISLLVLFLYSSFSLYAQQTGFKNFELKETTLDERWELTSTSNQGTFVLVPHKPIYILPGRWSNQPNELPTSLSPDNIAKTPNDYDRFEARFQLSLKTKVTTGLLFGKGDVWLGFTQTANWQVYNGKTSRPFRELNYEPEVIFNYPLPADASIFGLKPKMVGLALNHQSNGKSLPYSRSWNRVIFHAAFEYKDLSFTIRPWIRFSEKFDTDDNPQIENYMGVGDATFVYTYKEQVFSLMVRSNMRLNNQFKGIADFTWAYPIKGNLKAILQVTHGYGETLIDYNHKQTTVGLGVSLIEWL